MSGKFAFLGVNLFVLISVNGFAEPSEFNKQKKSWRLSLLLMGKMKPKTQQTMGKHHQYTNDGFHIGQLIRAELSRQGRSITWLAAQVNCTRENMYKLFQNPWINTDLLFQICKAMDYDFFKVCSEHYQKDVN